MKRVNFSRKLALLTFLPFFLTSVTGFMVSTGFNWWVWLACFSTLVLINLLLGGIYNDSSSVSEKER